MKFSTPPTPVLNVGKKLKFTTAKMPSKIVNDLAKQLEEVRKSLKTHLDEGVEIKLAIARVQGDQTWQKLLLIIILTAIAGLYLKQ
jgi:hypothetical protein